MDYCEHSSESGGSSCSYIVEVIQLFYPSVAVAFVLLLCILTDDVQSWLSVFDFLCGHAFLIQAYRCPDFRIRKVDQSHLRQN